MTGFFNHKVLRQLPAKAMWGKPSFIKIFLFNSHSHPGSIYISLYFTHGDLGTCPRSPLGRTQASPIWAPSLTQLPRSITAGWFANSMLNSLRNYPNVFAEAPPFHIPTSKALVPASPQPHQHFLFSIFKNYPHPSRFHYFLRQVNMTWR